MLRLIQDLIRKALADELLFGRLVDGGAVVVDIDDKDEIRLVFPEKTESSSSVPENKALELE